jgi:cardiolipin synthase
MKITANQVTLTRIVLLPIPCGMVLWGTDAGMLLALLIGAVLGATDAVDGYMARRDGPTVLGGLLDPAADKLFVAAFVLPFAAMGWCPPWVAAGVFLRELLITALRTSMALREERLVTSVLGKMKTIVQMGGLAVFYFTAFVPEQVMKVVHAAGAGGFVLVLLGTLAIKRKKPVYWVTGTAPLWTLVAAIVFVWGRDAAVLAIFVIMLVLTWVSGLDYFGGSFRVLRREGIKRDDLTRIFMASSHAAAIGIVTWLAPSAVVPLLIALAGELALGGIENIVAAEKKRPTTAPAPLPAVLAIAAAGVTIAFKDGPTLYPVLATSVYGLVSILVALSAFRRDRDVFNDA